MNQNTDKRRLSSTAGKRALDQVINRLDLRLLPDKEARRSLMDTSSNRPSIDDLPAAERFASTR